MTSIICKLLTPCVHPHMKQQINHITPFTEPIISGQYGMPFCFIYLIYDFLHSFPTVSFLPLPRGQLNVSDIYPQVCVYPCIVF